MKNLFLLLSFLIAALCLHTASAEEYYWATNANSGTRYSSAAEACDVKWETSSAIYPSNTKGSIEFYNNGGSVYCHMCSKSGSCTGHYGAFGRYGDRCSGTYNHQTGACDVPKECPEVGTSVAANVQCTYDKGTGTYVNTDRISLDGCEYISQPGGYFKAYPDYSDPANTFCVATFAASGDEAGIGSEEIPEDQAIPTPTDDPDLTCTKYGPHTICQSTKNPSCGTYDGGVYCNNESDTCGVFGAGEGTYQCIPKSGSRTCSYVQGTYTCVDKTSNEVIPQNSADHPNNGGNADGNPNNDEQAPGAVVVGGGKQGTGAGATNKSIGDLGDKLGDKLDAIGEALTGETENTPGAPVAPNERGTFDLEEWDQKIDDTKAELSDLTNDFGELFKGATSLNLSGSGGQLYCESYVVMGKSYELCLSKYANELSGIGLVILFLAALLAAYIIFVRD
ncbi:hypothetical protein [Pseudomonas sp. EL_65y_Pfl2_R95]|uniref:hypothetical protein n=1 Tax=Pseudomonas sp. EL_65y_Pfl2_R95 TaxID=3088698 RepID=UPI0030DC7234